MLIKKIEQIRQTLINRQICNLERQARQQASIAKQSPFQIYHYPVHSAESDQCLEELETKIKAQIDKEVNLIQMDRLEAQLKERAFILNERIQAEQFENETLDIVIKGLSNQRRIKKAMKDANKTTHAKLEAVEFGSQTEKRRTHEQGVGSEPTEGKKKPNLIHQRQVVSIAVTSSLPPRELQNTNLQQISICSMPRNQANLQQLYLQIEREMKYLKFLKGEKSQKRNYKLQKSRVSFLMETFWKNAPQVSDGQADALSNASIELPLLPEHKSD